MTNLGAECYNTVGDRLARPDEMEGTLVARLLSEDTHKAAEAVYHIEAGQDETLMLPKEPRNLCGL